MGFINNFKKIAGEETEKRKKGIFGKLFAKGLTSILPFIIIVVLLFFTAFTVFEWLSEIISGKNTPQKIYDFFEVEDISELIQIKGNDNDGYYLDFVDDIDDRVNQLIKEINGSGEYQNIPTDTDFVKSLIKAEAYTQFPDLGGKIPEDSEDGFQGAIKIRRVTPNKQPGEMKNTGKGETSTVEQEEADDPVEITNKDNANILSELKEGHKVKPKVDETPVYEKLEGDYFAIKRNEYLAEIRINQDDVVTYTGNYTVVENMLTGGTTEYIEVILDDNSKGYLNLSEVTVVVEESSIDEENSIQKVASTSRAETSRETIGEEGQEYVVAIAAGHNNTDNTGASSGNLVEEELTIQVAERVEELLDDYSNIKVVQTGSTSDNPGGIKVTERTELAKEADPDLCIQIHFNAGGGTGVEAIYKDGDGISQQLAEILSDTISSAMGLTNRQAGTDLEKSGKSLTIIENTVSTGFPSVVTEGGFLDGEPDASIIADDGVEKYAQGIVEGIDEYFKADHSGYSSIEAGPTTFTDSIESRIINTKYVTPEKMQEYIDNGDLENALKSYTLDENRNLITVTWSQNQDGTIEIKTNSSMDLASSLQKYVMPFEYLLFYYIDTDYDDFVLDLADKVMEAEIVIAIQDNITTTQTTNTEQEKSVSSADNYNYDWRNTGRVESYITETVSTSVNLTYIDTWFVKTYQENSYSEAVLSIGDAEEKIVEVPGKVSVTSSSSISEETLVSNENIEITTIGGQTSTVNVKKYQRTTTDTETISNQYEKGEYKTEGKESVFVELYNEHDMINKVRTTDYLFKLIEENEKTANLLDLTKYLIYKATNIPWGVLEFDYSEYSLEAFNKISSTGQIPLYTPVLSREDFIAAMEAYSYNSSYETNFKPNAALIYDESVANGINPELVVVTAQSEQGYRAGGGAYNYWGIAVYNGSSSGSGFSSLADGIAGYASVVKSYETDSSKASLISARAAEREAAGCSPLGYGQPGTLSGMQSIYSYLGKHGWAYSGSGSGGYYYMDPAVAGVTAIYSTHEEFVQKCLNGGAEHASGTETTIWEQGQYTAYQVQQKIDIWNDIFGSYGSLSGSGGNQQIIEIAKQYLGVPYVWGGTTPSGFDCSGFVQYVYAQVGISLPRTTSAYRPYLGTANEVSKENAQPGDLVWFYNNGHGHIGIYLGNDEYIHAPEPGDVVKISSGAMSYFTNVFRFE